MDDPRTYEMLGSLQGDMRSVRRELEGLSRQVTKLLDEHDATRRMVDEHRTGMRMIRWIGGLFLALFSAWMAWRSSQGG